MINSPDFEAAKFWVGNLGKTATHAMVFAQLYTPDGVCHGLHSFIVPVILPPSAFFLKIACFVILNMKTPVLKGSTKFCF